MPLVAAVSGSFILVSVFLHAESLVVMNSLFARLAFAAIVGFAVEPITSNAQTQAEMNLHASRDFDQADGSLNVVYKQLIAKLDDEAQTKLKEAQRAWLEFRDAQARCESDLGARGGTMAPLIYHLTRTALTEARIKDLKRLLKETAN